jgi:hypothetical protein
MAINLSPPEMRGVWLVLTLCPSCRADTEYYCETHRVTPFSRGNRKAAPRRLLRPEISG